MLKTKSIYDPIAEEDGLRVLVSRYWPRGIKKESSHHWCRELGPAPSLIKAWKSGQVTWPEFTSLYIDEFDSITKREALAEVASIINRAGTSPAKTKLFAPAVTLLCTCRSGKPCHRDLLKKILER